nr:hypothetical protein Itr_chr07CG15240 [Ipomoea trifida]
MALTTLAKDYGTNQWQEVERDDTMSLR